MDDAARGSLNRSEISESCFSALENSLKRYLDDSLLFRKNQENQKNIIQKLISDIAHQTLTPVSNLKLYSELLKEEQKEPSEKIDTILERSEKLDFLIQSLIRLSRLENGLILVSPREASLSALMNHIFREYTAKAAEKQIALSIPDTTLTAVFDLKWTSEAVGNIVDNALKYTPRGGQVSVTAEKYSFFVRINIADSGIGISETEINQIFKRFYRSFEVSDEPGTGIGLYLSLEILQAQKGYVKVTSEKNKGSVFSVFLPPAES